MTPRSQTLRSRHLAATTCAIAVAALLSGCTTKEAPVHTQADLDARPALSEMLTRYDRMQQEVRAAVDTVMGPRDWKQYDEFRGQGGCGRDFAPGVDGTTETLPPWAFTAPITDAQWPAIKKATLDIVARYGFQPAGLSADQGPKHQLNAFDVTLGAHFKLGNDVNTSMQVTTGCHPTRT